MAFPKDLDELVAAGYIFDNDATCRVGISETSIHKIIHLKTWRHVQ